jgi:hypothetical protein
MKSISVLKYICIIFCFSFFHFSCNSKKTTENILSFKLEVPENTGSSKTKFEHKEYKMSLQGVFVINGTNSGISISWIIKENDSQKLTLNMFLPSGPKFKVWVKNEPDVIYMIPTLPFAISASDYKDQGANDGNKAYLYLRRDYVNNLGYVQKIESVSFSEFTFEISELKFSRNALTMQCKFTGAINKEHKNLYDADYAISGQFSVVNYNSGISDAKDKQ